MNGCPFCPPPRHRTIRRGLFVTTLCSDPRATDNHLLIVPNRHVVRFDQLNWLERLAISREQRRLIRIMLFSLSAPSWEAISGYDLWQKFEPTEPDGPVKVSHFHWHLIPRRKNDELAQLSRADFTRLSEEELQILLARYRPGWRRA